MEYYTIEGIVVDQYGSALTDATVMITEGSTPTPDIAAITDEWGRFTLYDIPQGRYLLRAVYDGQPVSRSVVISSDTAGIKMTISVY